MRIHPEAAREARAARRLYGERDPRVGQRFLAEYKRALDKVAETPERWPAHLGVHRFLLKGFPFSLIYKRDPDGVVDVLAVAHHSQCPGYWRQRTV